MPAPIFYAHKILEELSLYRKNNDSFFFPDSKSQVSMLYEDGIPKVESIVVSTQHDNNANNQEIRKKVISIIEKAIPSDILPHKDKILINPTGRFVIGGPDGDTGLTGRKIIVDTYGGSAPHGGGAFRKGPIQKLIDPQLIWQGSLLRILLELRFQGNV